MNRINGRQIGKRCLPHRRQGSLTGQATLEMACALICIFLLLVGALNLFIRFNNRLVLRHLDYEHSRAAGSSSIKTVGSYHTNQWGGGNEARCNDGDVAIGYLDSGDDEVHCAKLKIEKCSP